MFKSVKPTIPGLTDLTLGLIYLLILIGIIIIILIWVVKWIKAKLCVDYLFLSSSFCTTFRPIFTRWGKIIFYHTTLYKILIIFKSTYRNPGHARDARDVLFQLYNDIRRRFIQIRQNVRVFENLTSLVIEMFNAYLDLRASLYNVDILYNNPQMILPQLENLGIENNQQLMRKVFHPYYHLDRSSICTKVLTNIDQNQNKLIFKNQTTM